MGILIVAALISFGVFVGGNAVISTEKIQVCTQVSETVTICKTVKAKQYYLDEDSNID